MSKRVPLTQGLYAIVDDEDYPEVSKYRWFATKRRGTAYARREYVVDGRRKQISLHTFLTGFALTDHANGDGLDNRRSNLREATKAQNTANSGSRRGTSRYRGVAWAKHCGRWRASLTYSDPDGHRRRKHLGYFNDEEDAARASDAAARELWGEFACLNFPESGERSALRDAA